MNRDGLHPGGDGNVRAGRLPVRVTYRLHCAECGEERSIRYGANPHFYLLTPTLLDGWQWVGDRLICPLHRVRVEDVEKPRKRTIWTCPHCRQYRWEGEVAPGECPACLDRCCCQWDKEEIPNAQA